MASIITHFTHGRQNHHLLPMEKEVEFECGACKQRYTNLAGYKCNLCEFMIHSICASIGDGMITSFMHPQHGLALLSEHCRNELRGVFCDVCGLIVRGMWYRCAACRFDMHPICSTLPQFSSIRAHPDDQVRLAAGRLGARCGVCKGDCSSGRNYRCDRCDFDCHLKCTIHASAKGEDRLILYNVSRGSTRIRKTIPADKVNTSAKGEDRLILYDPLRRRIRKRDVAIMILPVIFRLAIDTAVGVPGVADVITGLLS